MLYRLEVEAVRLHSIQTLVQDGAKCTRLLHEINSAQKALTSVRTGWFKYTLSNSFSILQNTQDKEIQRKEIRKIVELISEASKYLSELER